MKLTWKFYIIFIEISRLSHWFNTFVQCGDFSQLRGESTYLSREISIIYDFVCFKSVSTFSFPFLSFSFLVLLSSSIFLLLSRSLSFSLSLLFSFSSLVSLLQSSYQQLSTLTNNSSVSKQLSLGSWKLRMLSGYVCRVMAVLQKAATRN